MQNRSINDIRDDLKKQRERWMRERELEQDKEDIMQKVQQTQSRIQNNEIEQ